MASKRGSAPKGSPRIFLVDDHSIVRDGLKQLIQAQGEFAVCGEAESGPQALALLPASRPDLAIIDLGLQGMNGLELIAAVKLKLPGLPMLVMSMYEEAVYAERALRAGARGYIMKKGKSEELLKAIRQVLSGKVYVSDQMTERMMDKVASGSGVASPVDVLTEREFQVFQLIGRGFKTGRIAEELHVSVKTVESYREEIKQKLSLDNAAELTRYAVDWMHNNRISS
jgi:DNA-binding NarL/FixJ family response regulator